MTGLFVDGFAGGGGASTGIARAIGRDVDIAINHDPCAIAIHQANHATTEHHCQDIRIVWPLAATKMRPVWGAWFSPDCKEHSKAKGGPVKDRNIRQLPMEILPWLRDTRPKVCWVENVEEMQQWGPLDEQGRIIPELKGKEFKRWIRAIRGLGYRVQHRELRACDYGTPTSRKRLYIVMRSDGEKIVWPKPTHGPANDNRVLSGKLLPYKTAADCIDWSIHCQSIFDRARPLKENTERRIAHGVMRYVVNAARPFIVPVTHSGDVRAHDSLEPLRTITTANGGEFAAVDCKLVPHITKFRTGSVGSDMADPLPTVDSRQNCRDPRPLCRRGKGRRKSRRKAHSVTKAVYKTTESNGFLRGVQDPVYKFIQLFQREPRNHNPRVGGSSPSSATTVLSAYFPDLTCKHSTWLGV